MIRVVTNSLGSGDWIEVLDRETGAVLFQGHSISPRDLIQILTFDDSLQAELVEVTDEQMEQGEY